MSPISVLPFQKLSYSNGDCSFEWQSLLNTPCYGFNGPNACYSSTCKHDGSRSTATATKRQHSIGQKSASPNLSLKFNWQTLCGSGSTNGTSSDGVEHVLATVSTDIGKDSPKVKSSVAEQMNTSWHSNGIQPEYNGTHYFIDQPIQQLFNVSPTIELNFHVKSINGAYHSRSNAIDFMSPHTNVPASIQNGQNGTSSESSYDGSGSNKSYTFNPLSKPFHPIKREPNLAEHPSEFVSCTAAETAMVTAAQSNGCSITSATAFSGFVGQHTKYVCILCSKTFGTDAELNEHIEKKVEHPHRCVFCDVAFAHGYQLHRHLWIHLKNHRRTRAFNCRACQKKFRSLNQLSKHFELCQYKLYIFF